MLFLDIKNVGRHVALLFDPYICNIPETTFFSVLIIRSANRGYHGQDWHEHIWKWNYYRKFWLCRKLCAKFDNNCVLESKVFHEEAYGHIFMIYTQFVLFTRVNVMTHVCHQIATTSTHMWEVNKETSGARHWLSGQVHNSHVLYVPSTSYASNCNLCGDTSTTLYVI